MKKSISVLFTAVVLSLLLSLGFTASAATNPYPQYQTIGGVTTVRCTYYAWQQAYERTGVALPNLGNGKNWYANAQSYGYSVGSVAKPNSIAVWTDSTYGHVGFVVSVSGSTMKVNEGGMLDENKNAYNGTGIMNNSTCYTTVGGNKSQWSTKELVGFIYLTEGVSSNVTVKNEESKNSITETNATLYGLVNKSSSASVSQIGIKIWKDGSAESTAKTKYEAPSKNYVGETYMYPFYNMNTELNYTLTHATKYWYKIYAKVDGKEYWSSATSFKTKGSHSYGGWTTTKEARCTETGNKKRSCSCGATETAAISALGHNYSSSFTVDTPAKCTVAGSKSKHCTRCSAKTSVTSIPATGHSYGAWSTTKSPSCTGTGTKQRKCSCGSVETGTVAALGHNYSSEWTVDSPAKCTVAGSKSHHCTRCSAISNSTTISAVGHKWGDWQVKEKATVSKDGKEVRSCLNSDCNATQTKTLPKLPEENHIHSFGEWQTEISASCTEDGLNASKCSSCSAKQTQTISATGHAFGDWVREEEPTTEKKGLEVRACGNCSVIEERLLSKLSSNESDNVSVAPPETNTDTQSSVSNEEEQREFPVWIAIAASALIVAGVGITFTALKFKRKI